MADLGSNQVSENASNNTQIPPNGAPEGWLPSQVNNTVRELMAACKRFWNRINAVKTSSGADGEYTLAYTNFSELYEGERISFKTNHTSSNEATLKINSFPAYPIKYSDGTAVTNIPSGTVVEVYYNNLEWQLLNTQGGLFTSLIVGNDAAISGDLEVVGDVGFGGSLSMNSNAITDVSDPTNDQDAATKIYIDTSVSDATTASALLTKIKTVDGSGSGLDADLLDGNHASAFATSDHTHSVATTGANGFMSSSDKTKLNGIESGATGDQTASEIRSLLLTVDGSGSGIDADLLDGNHASAFAASSHNHSASNITSGTFSNARISSSNVTQHMGDGYARNITGRAGTRKTVSTSGPSGGSDGDIWYQY